MPDYEPAVILSACRTPIGSFGGALKDVSAVDLGAIVIREAIRRADVKPVDLGDVIMGCVLQAGAGMNVVNLIVTELAVIDVTPRGLVLKEIASDTTVDKVRQATGADLILEGPIRTF